MKSIHYICIYYYKHLEHLADYLEIINYILKNYKGHNFKRDTDSHPRLQKL